MTASVDVVLSPAEELPDADGWLVIDILRATTTMCAFFEGGGRRLYPTASIEAARELRDRLAESGGSVLLMGERNALPPEGFDLGNSPLELLALDPSRRREAVMATTNGTKALLKAGAQGVPVWPVCARNASASAETALAAGGHIAILCAGRKGRSALDDGVCAGLLVDILRSRGRVRLSDGAETALRLWRSWEGDLAGALRSSDHGRDLLALGFGADMDYAAQRDAAGTVFHLDLGAPHPCIVTETRRCRDPERRKKQ